MDHFKCVCAACGVEFETYTSYGKPMFCHLHSDEHLKIVASKTARMATMYDAVFKEALVDFQAQRDLLVANRKALLKSTTPS